MKHQFFPGPTLARAAGLGLFWLAGCAASTDEPAAPDTRVIEASAAFAAVGEPAPNFELAWIDHEGPATLAELRGRVVLLEFWRSTCGPCMRAVPHLNELHEKLAGAGLAIVAVSNESEDRIRNQIEAVRMAYPVAKLTGSAVDDAYRIRAVPQAFLIDRSGTLVWRGHPASLTEEHVASLLE